MARVLMVHARYRAPGGEDASVSADASALRGLGLEVEEVIVPPGSGLGAAFNPLLYHGIARRLRAGRVDLVHVNNFFPTASPAVHWAALRAGVPVVQHLRNARFLCPAATAWRNGRPCADCAPAPWPGIRRGCWRGSRLATAVCAGVHRGHGAVWQRMDRFIAVSGFLRDTLRPVLGEVPIDVVPNRLAADPGRGAPGAARTGILFAGRLGTEKGLHVLAAAWERLPGRVPLTVIGDGPRRGDVPPAARWLGQVPAATVLAEMQRAAVVVVPSLWPEPFGRAALEAMACGTPVVASAVGGLPEVIGDAGVLVPPGDAGALAAALATVLQVPAGYGAAGRVRYLSRFDDGGRALVAVYEDVWRRRTSQANASRAKAGTTRR